MDVETKAAIAVYSEASAMEEGQPENYSADDFHKEFVTLRQHSNAVVYYHPKASEWEVEIYNDGKVRVVLPKTPYSSDEVLRISGCLTELKLVEKAQAYARELPREQKKYMDARERQVQKWREFVQNYKPTLSPGVLLRHSTHGTMATVVSNQLKFLARSTPVHMSCIDEEMYATTPVSPGVLRCYATVVYKMNDYPCQEAVVFQISDDHINGIAPFDPTLEGEPYFFEVYKE